MLHHLLNQSHLHVRRVGYNNLFLSTLSVQHDRFIVKHREHNLTLRAHNRDSVPSSRFMRHETPRRTARQTIAETETCIERVLHLIQSRHVLAETLSLHNRTKPILQQVNLMRRKVIEITATTCHFRLQSPWHLPSALIVQFSRWHSKTNLHRQHIPNVSTHHNLLRLLEIGQVASVESDKARNSRQLADAVHPQTVLIACRQWLLDIGRLSRLHRHDGKGGVRGWGSGDVHGSHIRVAHQRLGISIILPDAMTFSIRLGFSFVATHHRHHFASFNLTECRTALLLRHLTATNEAPLDYLLIFHYF